MTLSHSFYLENINLKCYKIFLSPVWNIFRQIRNTLEKETLIYFSLSSYAFNELLVLVALGRYCGPALEHTSSNPEPRIKIQLGIELNSVSYMSTCGFEPCRVLFIF